MSFFTATCVIMRIEIKRGGCESQENDFHVTLFGT